MNEDLFDKMRTLVGLLEMWEQNKARPSYLSALIEEANEFLAENDPYKVDDQS